jgi:aspartate aminotransferase
VASETFTSTSAPIQYAAVSALEDRPEMTTYLAHSRQILAALATHAYSALIDAGAVLHAASGGFYLFPRFENLRDNLVARGIDNGPLFCERLLEDTGVAVLPGNNFGRPAAELSARLAFVDFDGETALQMAAREPVDEAFVERHCRRVTTAMQLMADWAAG